MNKLFKKIRANKIVVSTFFVIFFGLIFFNLFTLENTFVTAQNQGGAPGAEMPEDTVAIETTKSYTGDFADHTSVSAQAVAAEEVSITARLQEVIESVNIKVGDRVEADQVLLKLNDRNSSLDLMQAEASLNSARANLQSTIDGPRAEEIEQQEAQLEQAESNFKLQEDNFNRQQQLFDEGYISQRELDQAENQLISARSNYRSVLKSLELMKVGASEAEIAAQRAQVQQAEVNYEKAKTNNSHTKIKAPISGIVAEVNAQKGEMAANSAVAVISNIDQIELTAYVSEVNVNNIRVGESAIVRFRSLNQSFEGEIESISPRTAPNRSSFPVIIKVNNPDNIIKSGMNAQVDLQISRAENIVLLDQNAILEENNENYVFVVTDGKAARKNIEISLESEEIAVIESGLEAGEEVVTLGKENLFDGSAVQIVNRGDN